MQLPNQIGQAGTRIGLPPVNEKYIHIPVVSHQFLNLGAVHLHQTCIVFCQSFGAGPTDQGALLVQDEKIIRGKVKAYGNALIRIWDNVVNTKTYLTGGLGQPGGPEGFTDDYLLGNGCYAETCSGIAYAMWNHRWHRMTGQSREVFAGVRCAQPVERFVDRPDRCRPHSQCGRQRAKRLVGRSRRELRGYESAPARSSRTSRRSNLPVSL